MRVLFINSVCGVGSTGRICVDLAEEFRKEGHECRIAYGRQCAEKYRHLGYKIGGKVSVCSSVLATRLFDVHGRTARTATKQFLTWADKYDPDLLWLHNIHGYYLNYEMLFNWIKSRPEMNVRWTLHDCWAFTGHCSYFTFIGCEKWKTHCESCPQRKQYPASILLDQSFKNYDIKKRSFTGVSNMSLVTPSQWLADLVAQSFLGNYRVDVEYNHVDTSVFRHRKSRFREQHDLSDKTVLLGVAFQWEERKGLQDFLELARRLDSRYAIVLVGLTARQIENFHKGVVGNAVRAESVGSTDESVVELPGGVAVSQSVDVLYKELVKRFPGKGNRTGSCSWILIEKTDNPEQLAELYSMADVFVNPTHEDNYPTTNLEARACGTFVITYDVGGCRETLE